MALNDYISNYKGWQNAATARNKAERELAAAQKAADSIPSSNKAAFDAAVANIATLKATRDSAKQKLDGIVSEATQKYNTRVGKSSLAKAQADYDFIDGQIKRKEALGQPIPDTFTKQRSDALVKLQAAPGYVGPGANTLTEGQTPKKEPKNKGSQSSQSFIPNALAGGNVPGPITGTPPRTAQQEIDAMSLAVNNRDSFESKGSAAADLGFDAFNSSKEVKAQIAAWKVPGTSRVGNNNRLEDIQILLRENKFSKGTTPLGILDRSDIDGLMKAVQTAKTNGSYTETFLNQVYTYKAANGLTASASSGGAITKTLVTSLKLLDAGDASNKLSNAYYKAYGRYPTQKQITSFKDQWNAEAKLQQAEGASYRAKGLNKDITVGEGFTESEQNAFLNRYLAKNLKMDAANLGGDTKKIYDEIRTVYRDNFLPEPDFSQVAGIVKDLLGTSDINVYNTKVAKIKQTVGKQAAAFYPSLEKELLDGDSVETYASVYRNTLATKWGVSAATLVNDKEAQDLIKSAVNFKTPDNKIRLMDNNEFNGLVQSTKRWKAGEEAFTSYSNIGDKLINAFNLQSGVK